MALYGDKSSTTENRTFRVTRLTWMGNTMSPNEVVVALLKPDNKCLRFFKADDE